MAEAKHTLAEIRERVDQGHTDECLRGILMSGKKCACGHADAARQLRVYRAAKAEAPAMLEALEELIAVCAPNIYPQPDKPNSAWAKLQNARAILARVKGETS